MKYSPSHKDTLMRAIYGFLIILGFALLLVGEGLLKTIFTSLSMVLLVTGMYLFIRYELTTFTYIVMENEKRLDFYVDRAVGRRGSYVCYFPLYDCVEIAALNKRELKEKYKKIAFYNYCNNRFTKNKQVLVFKIDDVYEAVVLELENGELDYFKKAVSLSKESIEE